MSPDVWRTAIAAVVGIYGGAFLISRTLDGDRLALGALCLVAGYLLGFTAGHYRRESDDA